MADGHLSQLAQTLSTTGGTDAGNYNPDRTGSLKRGYADWIEETGGSNIMSATKRQNINGNFSRFGAPSDLASESTLPGGPFSSGVLNSMTDNVELSEPKVTHQYFILQKDAPKLIEGDLIFACPLTPQEAEKFPNRFKGHPIKGSAGDLAVLTPIPAFNLADVNSELKTLQINKLKQANIASNDSVFYRHVLGSPDQYFKMFVPWGAIYKEMDADGGDSKMSSLGWTGTVKGSWPTIGFTQTKHVSVIKQGSHWIQDLWGGDLLQGTGLFLVLKPTIVSSTEYYEIGLDPAAAANRFTRAYLSKQGTKIVQRGIQPSEKVGNIENYVVYQWLPVASSGSKHISFKDDLEYYQQSIPPRKAFGHNNFVMTDVSTISAAYIQIGVVKHQTNESDTDRRELAQNYRLERQRPSIEVNLFPFLPQVI